MQRLVAAMQPPRLPVGDNIPITSQSRKIESCTSIRPLFPQQALYTFKIFPKSQAYLPTPAPWDECLEKETQVDFFRAEAPPYPIQPMTLLSFINQYPVGLFFYADIECQHALTRASALSLEFLSSPAAYF